MFKTIEFCSHYEKNGNIIVNATDHILRMQHSDGSIVEIPSSVLPKDIPDSYKEKAKKLGTTVEEVCDSSLFIWLKKEKTEINDLSNVISVISNICEEHDYNKTFILSTHPVAVYFAFNEEPIIFEPIYIDKDNYLIKSDFLAYYQMDKSI